MNKKYKEEDNLLLDKNKDISEERKTIANIFREKKEVEEIIKKELSEYINIAPDILMEKLSAYVDFLLEVNKTMNLISRASEEFIWHRHILDSLQLVKFVKKTDIILDIGSGAGFPAIVLSIAGVKKIYMVESVAKKVKFLEEASRFSDNELIIINKRVESIDINYFDKLDIITARAVANLDSLMHYIRKYLGVISHLLLLKGKNYQKEIENAKNHKWSFKYKRYSSITSKESVILSISNIEYKNKSH